MGYLSEKAAYLKGLSEGLEIKSDSKEGKRISAILAVLGEMAGEIEDIALMQDEMQSQLDDVDEALSDLEDEVDAISDDLSDIEDIFDELEEMDDEDEDFDPEDYLSFDEDDDEMWEEEYSFECPKCGDMVYVDVSLLDDGEEKIVCPSCKEPIVLEFDCDEEDE